MKKQIILGSFLALTSLTQAQNIFPSTGNSGIGLTNPTKALEIKTTVANDGIKITQLNTANGGHSTFRLDNAGGHNYGFCSSGGGSDEGTGNFILYDYSASRYNLFVKGSNGNVGIGTNAPNAALDILQNTSQTNGIKYTAQTAGNPAFEILQSGSTANSRFKSYGSGQTFIGNFTAPANNFNASGSMLTVGHSGANNKILNLVDNTNTGSLINLFSVFGNGRVELSTSGVNTGVQITQSGNTAATIRLNHSTSSEGNWALMGFGSGTTEGAGNFGIYDQNAPATRFFIAGSSTNPTGVNAGNVGIGTYIPKAKLAISSNVENALAITDENATTTDKRRFIVKTDGKTQIGTELLSSSPHYTSTMLSVNGKIVAKSCYITIADWADYVFDANYKIPNLYDVEAYYKANKHLPEIPSEKEVLENGVDIAEMNKLLLKKVEEITILLVNQQKEIDLLKGKIK